MTAYPIPDDAIDDRLAFVGTSGSGKTYAMMTAVERLLERKSKVVMVDPLGVAWGIRLKANGKDPAYPVVIFGGKRPDIAITEQSGRLIGEAIAGMAESAVVDLSELGSKAAERRFMLGLLEAMYRNASGEPFHLIFDEADLWAPQKSLEPQLQNLMENIVRRGRVKGFIPWLITQRPAVISKDVLSQVDGLVAMKLTAKQDRDALGAWIEGQADRAEQKDFNAKLPAMQRGHGIVWIPGRGVLKTAKFPTKQTFDSSRTPERGETRRTAELKPIDIGKLKAAIAAIETEKAKGKAVAKATPTTAAPAPDQAAIDRAIALGIEKALADARPRIFEEGRRVGHTEGQKEALRSVQAAIAAVRPNEPTLAALPPRAAPSAPVTPIRATPARPPATKTSASATAGLPDGFAITKPMQRILDVLAWFESIGMGSQAKDVVAYMAEASATSSSFTNNLGALRNQAGLIDYPAPAEVCLTDLGRQFAVPPERSISIDDLHRNIKAHLERPQQRILDVLIELYPNAISKVELAERVEASATSSRFTNNLGRMRSLGFIDYPASGQVIATRLLFPEGLAA